MGQHSYQIYIDTLDGMVGQLAKRNPLVVLSSEMARQNLERCLAVARGEHPFDSGGVSSPELAQILRKLAQTDEQGEDRAKDRLFALIERARAKIAALGAWTFCNAYSWYVAGCEKAKLKPESREHHDRVIHCEGPDQQEALITQLRVGIVWVMHRKILKHWSQNGQFPLGSALSEDPQPENSDATCLLTNPFALSPPSSRPATPHQSLRLPCSP